MNRLAIAMLALALAGCQVGSGSGWVRGSAFLPECGYGEGGEASGAGEALDVPLSYFFGDVHGDGIDIRLQTSGAAVDVTDGMTFAIRNRHDVAAEVRAHGSATVPILAEEPSLPLAGPDLVARATLYLNSSCHDSYVDFTHGVGTLVFTSMYAREADGDAANIDRITATFTGLSFRDERPELAVDGQFPWATVDGAFDFDYTRGRPAQPFP
ncbi:MAG: hypothetical protein HY905_14560 [Deltaproteobacteria bacterium]|nr:hypothetical protein [Deltaproteobacteria bacterium]